MKHLVLFASLILSFEVGVSLELGLLESTVIPSEILVTVGESLYIKVKNPVASQTSCKYKAPGKKEINSPDAFVKFSDDECGIKIEKVQQSHVGAWKLILTFKNSTHEGSIQGTSVVGVREPITVAVKRDQIFSSSENFAPTGYNLNYCFVSKTTGSMKLSEIETAKCMIPQGLNDEYRDGIWNVRMGVEGISKEVTFSVNIQAMEESIETIVKVENDVAQLLCRVKNLKNVLKFCRFERLGGDDFGLNLEDGIGVDNYRYHGRGLAYGECGLQINNLNSIDKTQWRCYLGLIDAADAMKAIADEEKKVYKHSTVLDASDAWNKLKIINENSDIYLVDNQSAVIQCNANNPFDYCWIQNPSKKFISISDKRIPTENDEYQYHGDGFHLGQCGVKIKHFFYSDAGEWKCGVGRTLESMKEAVKPLRVEVKSSNMMAVTKQIEDFSGNSIVIQCRAIPIGSSLSSCHFLMPNGEAFSINDRVTKDDAIDGLFYFDPNRKLSDGYCTVVIKQLNRKMHAGKWICGGKIRGHQEESYDEVQVTVDSIRGASISIITLATVLPLIALMALSGFGYKKYKNWQRFRLLDNTSLATVTSNASINSNSSGDSQNEIIAGPSRSISVSS